MMIRTEMLHSYERRLSWVWNAVLVAGAAYALALSAQMRVGVPFSPVPVTAQTLVVLLIGALMDRHHALASVGAYLAAGAVGLPFFASGTLWGPTGGYLLGFVASVYLLTSLRDVGRSRHPVTVIAPLVVANGVIYLVGLPWLALFVGPGAALSMGFFPFLAGDLVKLSCAAAVVWAVRQRLERGH